MRELRLVVCVKPVPAPEHYGRVSIDPATKSLVRQGIPTVLNPLDKNALEASLAMRDQAGGEVLVVSMAPPQAQENLQQALAMGADRLYLLSDPAFSGSDTLVTSMILAAAIKKLGPVDLVLTGNYSADGGTAQVSAQLGEWLGYPHLMHVAGIDLEGGDSLRVQTLRDGCRVVYQVKMPAVLAVTRGINTPRYTSLMGIIAARNKPSQVWGAPDLQLDPANLGLKGSPTCAGGVYKLEVNRQALLLQGDSEKIAVELLQRMRTAGLKI